MKELSEDRSWVKTGDQSVQSIADRAGLKLGAIEPGFAADLTSKLCANAYFPLFHDDMLIGSIRYRASTQFIYFCDLQFWIATLVLIHIRLFLKQMCCPHGWPESWHSPSKVKI